MVQYLNAAFATRVLKVEHGHVTAAGPYNGEPLNWDVRASADNWNKWIKSPPGMMGLGMAYTSRKLKFNVGDYGAMRRVSPLPVQPYMVFC